MGQVKFRHGRCDHASSPQRVIAPFHRPDLYLGMELVQITQLFSPTSDEQIPVDIEVGVIGVFDHEL